jgi:hypothetical protein
MAGDHDFTFVVYSPTDRIIPAVRGFPTNGREPFRRLVSQGFHLAEVHHTLERGQGAEFLE